MYNKQFTQLSDLHKHNFIHTGEHRYLCKICNKRFAQLSDLTRHEVIHTGERRYLCKICNKRFTQLSDLTTVPDTWLFTQEIVDISARYVTHDLLIRQPKKSIMSYTQVNVDLSVSCVINNLISHHI